jgi:hypothetical protein
MIKIRGKIIALLLLPAFAVSCAGPMVHVAPEEVGKIAQGREVTVRTAENGEWTFDSIRVEKETIIGTLASGVTKEMPFSTVQAVTVRKPGGGSGVVLVLDLLLAAGMGIGAAVAPSPPPVTSCPLIYSFDGRDFTLEAEPYGGAVLKGLQRTEWIGLDRLKATGGFFKLRAANDLSESEYLDELKLMIVDHASGARALPDANGRIHIISDPVPPLRAIAKGGFDVRAALAKNDRSFWEPAYPTAPAALSAASAMPRAGGPAPSSEEIAEATPIGDLRDELVLEFPKPAGARSAKLVANAWTTLWGSAVAKDIVSLHGRELPAWAAEVDARGPEYRRIMGWFLTEELYMLKVEIDTKAGWKPRTVIFGGGPIIARDKAYLLDISDAAGDTLKIRMRPPAGFWRFNSFAVDYGDAAPLRVEEISPAQARDAAGRDVRTSLAAADGDYFTMPRAGEYAEVLFAVPPAPPGAARSVVLKASGYYDPHLSADGEPRNDLLRRIHAQPGATLRFAYAEHLRRLFESGLAPVRIPASR